MLQQKHRHSKLVKHLKTQLNSNRISTVCGRFVRLSDRSPQSGDSLWVDFPEGGRAVRIDKYLKVTRLIKRRTVANEVADVGRVTVNGKVAKASYQVKVGDIIDITFGNRRVSVRVDRVEDNVRKDFAREMYTILDEEFVSPPKFASEE